LFPLTLAKVSTDFQICAPWTFFSSSPPIFFGAFLPTNKPNFGGAEFFAYELSRNLSHNSHPTAIFCQTLHSQRLFVSLYRILFQLFLVTMFSCRFLIVALALLAVALAQENRPVRLRRNLHNVWQVAAEPLQHNNNMEQMFASRELMSRLLQVESMSMSMSI
jgi:hypothetical protein